MSKVKLSITIDDTIYNMFKHKPNISRYIQEVLREELIEQQRDSIASRLVNQLNSDDDFKRLVKNLLPWLYGRAEERLLERLDCAIIIL